MLQARIRIRRTRWNSARPMRTFRKLMQTWWKPIPRLPIALLAIRSTALALPVTSPAAAAWPPSPNQFLSVCSAIGTQTYPAITPDGSGGAIICWSDDRNAATTGLDIYSQRVTGNGILLWKPGGVLVCGASTPQEFPLLVSDGAGGAILVWTDYRNGGNADVWAQRINSIGAPLWQNNGIQIASVAGVRRNPDIVSDGMGGAVIAWEEYPSGGVRAQRISSGGIRQWVGSGAEACGAGALAPSICSDGGSGVLIAWEYFRNGQSDIFAQRVTSSGSVAWASGGIPVAEVANNQRHPKTVTDGGGGAVITWEDRRGGDYYNMNDIYVQRISPTGSPLWTPNGVGVCVVNFEQTTPTVVTDGGGGGIVVWRDQRTSDPDVYAQRVSGQGVPLWTQGGVQLSGWPGDYRPTAVSDGRGGALIAWEKRWSGPGDIFARRLNGLGVDQWIPGGTPVYTNGESTFPAIASDGLGGAIFAWSTGDIDAQRIAVDGPTPLLASLASSEVRGSTVSLAWYGQGLGETQATVYRRTRTEGWTSAGSPRGDGPDRLVFVDHLIVRGREYGYRLEYRVQGEETLTSENWIDVPAFVISLDAPAPNPVEGDLVVSFSLPSSDPARLRVLDVAGRVLEDREVGALGPGYHRLSLSEGNRLPPGAFSIVLSQSGRTIVRRVAFVR